jgi:hypothetical protein
MFKRFIIEFFTLLPLLLAPNFVGVVHATQADPVKQNRVFSTSILSKVPSDKATVGVIPYYVKDNQVYIEKVNSLILAAALN